MIEQSREGDYRILALNIWNLYTASIQFGKRRGGPTCPPGNVHMNALKALNLGITFLLELCMLAALAYWGFQTSDNLPVRIILGIGAPVLAAVIWGRFLAPKSTTRLTGLAYLALKFILFGLAAIALAAAGQPTLAIIFVVASVINQLLLFAWKDEKVQQTGAG
jgi:hypothetical protein